METPYIDGRRLSLRVESACADATVDLAIRLWALARDLQEQGDCARARDAALDATAVWAVDRSSLEEEVLLELLVDLCGERASAILTSACQSAPLAAWKLGSGALPS